MEKKTFRFFLGGFNDWHEWHPIMDIWRCGHFREIPKTFHPGLGDNER